MRFVLAAMVLLCVYLSAAQADPKDPVIIGFDGAYGLKGSTSAQSIELGVRVAIEEINQAGGVLGGRPLELVTRDNKTMPARTIDHITEFAAIPDLVALVTGRFSPTVLEALPAIHEHNMVTLAAWSAANGIVSNDYSPNYVFRLSLRDGNAIPFMLSHLMDQGHKNIGLLLTNTAWGRSNLAVAEAVLEATPEATLTQVAWYNWLDESLIDKYQAIRAADTDAVVIVANDTEGSILLNELAELPDDELLPIVSHWGVSGGQLYETLADPTILERVNFLVIQTFSLFNLSEDRQAATLSKIQALTDLNRLEDLPSHVGFGHAYDLVHILARAIEIAGSTDRSAIRDALEQVTDYNGLVDDFAQPFSPDRHEALAKEHLFFGHYDQAGVLRPATDQD
ncbi:MAG: ABC transporter substrate-binding protein [Rhodospirillaceae bacterium]